MIKRLYVHNFRCLENFELVLAGHSSVLLLGKNGSGKTTVALAFEILQKIARGTNRVGDLVKPSYLTSGRSQLPVRFEIEVTLGQRNYAYIIAFELPVGFRELRVLEEKLSVDGFPIFSRDHAQVRLARTGQATEAMFRIDWHLVALPIVQEQNGEDPLAIFKKWLSHLLILRPVPSLVRGDSELSPPQQNKPDRQVTNLGAWFRSIIGLRPASYLQILDYLAQLMPDLEEIKTPVSGADTASLVFQFRHGEQRAEVALDELSDGEKCFVIYALTIAENKAFGPVFCFWDEPDNFLAPDEVGQSIMALRRAFQDRGQLVVTSHNPEAIRRFSDQTTLYFSRRSHVEPTTVTSIEEMRSSGNFTGSFIDALLRGDIEP